MGEVPALTATLGTGELTGEAWLAGKDIPEATKATVRRLAKDRKIELEQAYRQYLQGARPYFL